MFYCVRLCCVLSCCVVLCHVPLCRGVIGGLPKNKGSGGDGRGTQDKTRQDKWMNGAAIAVCLPGLP